MGKAKRSAKQRIVEYSEDESEEDEDSDWTVEADEAAKTAASKGAIEPSETDKERTPKTVEGNRKQGAAGAAAGLENQRGSDEALTKMGGGCHDSSHTTQVT